MQTELYDKLLKEYREIWNNRRLEAEESPDFILKEAIARDLRDENSHPRARRTLMEKYFLATKRIVESALSNESKILLIQLHIMQAEEIKNSLE
ncbi:hypothetical protein V7654_11355 [Bacillus sp. JJ1609]|uniref:hypothetical protein n=1 Tax=Bacillus sp. JJ1609 TaxID=3122977 RepID=UPI002FFEF1D9